MKSIHVLRRNHIAGYCDLYVIVPDEEYEDRMGETAYDKGYDSFLKGDKINPRRVPPADLQGDALRCWFKGWDDAQRHNNERVRNRTEDTLARLDTYGPEGTICD